MPTVSDDRFTSLRAQGHTGATSDMLLSWLQAAGATAKAVPDAWREVLTGLGFTTGQFNDDWRDYLLSIAPAEIGDALSDLNAWFWKPVADGGNGGNLGPPTPSGPAWEAGTADPTTYEMLAQRIGQGTPTFTHTGLLLPDYEGVYRDIPANTAPWHGARIAKNWILWSEDFTNAAWLTFEVTTTTGVADPLGGNTAVTVTATGSGNPPAFYQQRGSAVVQGNEYRCSAWIRRRTGTGDVFLRGINNAGGEAVDITSQLTGEWQRFTTPPQVATQAFIWWAVNPRVAGDEIDVAFCMVEDVTGTTNQNPSEYVTTTTDTAVAAYNSTNGNTVSNNVVQENIGVPLAELPSLYAAPAATNLVTWSRDATQTPWSEVSSTVTYDAEGLTGEPNTASSVEMTATSNSWIAYNTTTNISGPTYVVRTYLKKPTVNDWVAIQVRISDGSFLQMWADLAAGNLGTVEVGITAQIDNIGNGWFEVYLEIPETTSNRLVRIGARTGDGSATSTAGDTFVLGQTEMYDNTSLSSIRGASPIITEGSTGSTTRVDMDADPLNTDESQGGWYAEVRLASPDTVTQNGSFFMCHTNPGGTQGLWFNASTRISGNPRPSSTPTNAASVVGLDGDMPSTGWGSIGAAYELGTTQNGVRGNLGAWVEGNSYAGEFGSLFNVYRGTDFPRLVRNIRRYNLSYSAAKDKIDELMSG